MFSTKWLMSSAEFCSIFLLRLANEINKYLFVFSWTFIERPSEVMFFGESMWFRKIFILDICHFASTEKVEL